MPDQRNLRQELVDELFSKLEETYYPSPAMLDLIESILTPDDVERYVGLLLEIIRDDEFPSYSMIRRAAAFS